LRKKGMVKPIDKKRIKILLVIDGILFGGGARVFLQLAEGLINRGHRVFVACVPDGELAPLLKASGIELLPVNFKSKNILCVINQLHAHLCDKSIDVVNSQGGRVDFYARMAARMLKPKVKIVNTVAVLVEGYDVNLFKKFAYVVLDRFAKRFVDRFIVVSNVLRKTLVSNYGIASDKVFKIYNGIELSEYHPDYSGESFKSVRKEYNIGEEVCLIGAVGRMVWQKGFKYLIESIPTIIETLPQSKILIVGDGPLLDGLKTLSERLKVEKNIIFTGFRSDIKEILSAVDLFVVPSILEGFPVVTLEAMAMAKPIVATNIDGITEQITDGVNGVLVPPKDPSALAKAIIKVINDKELARTMGSSARKKVEQEFSVEKMVAETEKVYLSLLKIG
jgi:glycosyltransferase involved in cell wall biosynthesis